MNSTAPPEEGVTKFDLVFTRSAPLEARALRALIAWRDILWRLGLVGQDSKRYGGVGFGNLSRRRPAPKHADPRFAITGTQTGALSTLDVNHFAIVDGCDPEHNRVLAQGPIAPSSESLTHAMLYRISASINFIFHVHSPEIWQARATLKLPATAADVAYGTPAMAAEMKRLKRSGAFKRQPIVVMAGHQDGVISFGRTAEQAGLMLLRTLANAMTLD